ncbi:MAG TPA: acyl carrier protein [Acidimicrobiia bacterium]|nr:acyl carrier protein [Acidimicrobiia bacterium]
MTPEQARRVIFDVLADIAPEVDESTVDDDHDLTEQLDLDSMDYLNWMVGINEETRVDIPQRDVSEFLTIAGAVAYLVTHSPEPAGERAGATADPRGLAAV